MTNKYSYVSDCVTYIGADDLTIDLFEGQYVVPDGVSYNSYVINDEKMCVIDTVDARMSDVWFDNLRAALDGRVPDYLVVLHCEPDHAGNVARLLAEYPSCIAVCSVKALQFLGQFFPDFDFEGRVRVVKEGDELCLGRHTLSFIAAPLVHWPEVLMAYERTEKILFTADGFGKFGAICNETGDWACEARRYYFNICGKYGAQVQAVLKKAAALDIAVICPLHGPVLRDNLPYYIGLYDTWSSYRPETDGVFIAYCSMHGGTAQAAVTLGDMLRAKGVKVSMSDIARDDMAEAIEDAFRYSRMVLCAPTYDGGVMPVMADFLHHLVAKNYQRRTVALVENGTWAPQAARIMRETLEKMKEITVLDTVVTIRSAMTPDTEEALSVLSQEVAQA